MKESTYDPCLLYSFGPFGVVEIQTDDILILADNNFARKDETVIQSTKIMTKERKYLTYAHPLKFNST